MYIDKPEVKSQAKKGKRELAFGLSLKSHGPCLLKPFFLDYTSTRYRSTLQSLRGPPSAILMTVTTKFNVRRVGRPQA